VGLFDSGPQAEQGLRRVTTTTAFRRWFLLADHGPEHPQLSNGAEQEESGLGAAVTLLVGANDLQVLPPRPESYIKTFDPVIIEAMECLQATVEIHRQISNRPAGA